MNNFNVYMGTCIYYFYYITFENHFILFLINYLYIIF